MKLILAGVGLNGVAEGEALDCLHFEDRLQARIVWEPEQYRAAGNLPRRAVS